MSDLMVARFRSARPTAERTGARRVVSSLRIMLRSYQTRDALLELSPRQRDDIGVSASAALAEAARLPWDVAPGPRRRTTRVMDAIQDALERARTRRLISRLEYRELIDIGLSEARGEAAKFFWQR